jgi:hypothetical protein
MQYPARSDRYRFPDEHPLLLLLLFHGSSRMAFMAGLVDTLHSTNWYKVATLNPHDNNYRGTHIPEAGSLPVSAGWGTP